MKSSSIILIIILFLFLFCPVLSSAQEFSADTVSVIKGKEMKGKLYWMHDRLRIEMWAGDRHQISIIRKDKKIVWHIADQQKQYLEFPLREEDLPVAVGQKILGEVKREKLGNETVQGRKTVKYKVYFKIKDREGFTYQWVDEKYRIPIHTSFNDGQYDTAIVNITPGPQAAGLFELPSDVTRYTISPGPGKSTGPSGPRSP